MKLLRTSLAFATLLFVVALPALADRWFCSQSGGGRRCALVYDDGETGSTECDQEYQITFFLCELGGQDCLHTVVTDGSCSRCTYQLF